MNYTYEITSGPKAGETVDVEHSMKEPARTELVVDGETVQVKRLISGGPPFILKGSAWARDNYTHGTQCYDPRNRDEHGPK